jgi:hypothetical protein
LTSYSSCFGFLFICLHISLGINSLSLLVEISWSGDFEL